MRKETPKTDTKKRRPQQTAAYWQSILNGIEDEVAVIDQDFRVIYAYEAVMRKYGFDKSKVIGRHCYEFAKSALEPCASPACICPASEVWNTGESAQAVHLHYYGSGNDIEESYVEVKASPLRDNRDDVSETILVIRDITRAKRMAQRILVKGF